jgi:hypothetical protein
MHIRALVKQAANETRSAERKGTVVHLLPEVL